MGIDSLTQQNIQNAGLTGIDRLASNAMFPQSQMDKTQYAVSSQMPTSAETLASDYDAPNNSYTGMPTKPFAAGGIATLRYNGEEDGSQVQAWDPESGKVKLQQINLQDLSVAKTSDYTIPKDQIQSFNPALDNEGNSTGGGSYILKDGSQMNVGADGVVTGATPARDEYTLNKDGYYQPTGSGLTWDGNSNTLSKKIGGIDVLVPSLYQKGGYQDEQGGLRVDANGVPIALAPNFADSGAGKSGLSDAAPYIAMATLAAMGMPAGAMAFEGMVPASETLMGSLGTGATTTGGGFGINAAGTGNTAGAMTLPSVPGSYGGISAGALGTGVPASLTVPTTGALAGGAAAAGGFGAKQAYAAKMAMDMLNSGAKTGGGGGQPGAVQQVSAAPTIPTINRFGVTGYEGQTPTSEVNFRPISLSKIKGAGTDYTFAEGGMAMGGISTLGSYSDGGRLLKGPGDGMSDNIPAKIGDAQPARLADGEFVVPADVVSHLGNGSTDAGAKQLYAMMDKIRKARTGNKKQGKQINPSKFLP
jgi:hypothetical protein